MRIDKCLMQAAHKKIKEQTMKWNKVKFRDTKTTKTIEHRKRTEQLTEQLQNI